MESSISNLAVNYNTDIFSIIEAYDNAHEQLIKYALEHGYNCTISVHEGEVYLENNGSKWFEDNVQRLFDEFLIHILNNLAN